MKRLISATLALSLLGGTAAVAAPYDHGNQGYNGGYSNQDYNSGDSNRDRSDNYRGHGNNNGAVVAGIGFLALAAILASQNHHPYHQGWHNHDDRNYGYGNGYNRGYGDNYRERDGGYSDSGRRW